MENFSLFYSNDEDAIMSYNDIRNFQLAWNIIDVNRKVSISITRVLDAFITVLVKES
ncbi:unnamed protein product [Trichobilharzia regenti]|nr:unnamed protein product [Trichobilharzia regenti]